MLCWCFSVWLPVCTVLSWAELMCRVPTSGRNWSPVYLLQSGPDCWSCNGVDNTAVVDQTRWEHGPNTYLVEFRGCLFVFLIHPWKVAILNKIHLKRNINLFQIINTDVFGFPLQFGKNSLMYLFPSDPHLVKPLLPETSNDCGVIKHESLIWTD